MGSILVRATRSIVPFCSAGWVAVPIPTDVTDPSFLETLPGDRRAVRGPPSRAIQSAAGAAVCLVLGWFAFVRSTRVPFLSLVDLGFHELGHMLTMWAPRLVYFAMGSIDQIAVPLGLAGYFFLIRRDAVGGGSCLAWAGTSAQNVSVYVADAPYQLLPLIGGKHDWAFILGPSHLNMLGSAHTIAGAVKVFGLSCLLAGFAACCWTAWTSLPRRTVGETPAAGPRVAPVAPNADPVGMWR
jgi:hypothetical protein